MTKLSVHPITAQAFAPFGTLIAWPHHANQNTQSINGGTSQRLDFAGALDLSAAAGQPGLALFHAQAQALPHSAHALEVHRHGSQTFVPLGCSAERPCYVVLVALGDAAGRLREDSLQAFVCHGAQAVSLKPGIWHHPLLALVNASFVVMERLGSTVDCETQNLSHPVRVALLPS